MSTSLLVEALGPALQPFGLNLIGVARASDYDALVPATHRLVRDDAHAEEQRSSRMEEQEPDAHLETPRAAIVIGNGGGAFWGAYREHVAHHPGHEARAHPLDDFTAEIMEGSVLALARRLGIRAELRLPFRPSDPPLSFVHLAEAAGLGRRSILGVLIHPEFGPWIALRGALLVEEEARAARPAAGFDPCPHCRDRPCITACPGSAVAFPQGWDIPRCIDHRLAERGACEDRCHARVACVYGRAHRYPPDALAYHQRRAFAVMAPTRSSS